ncbi:MAG: metallophosphoesterase family protein [Desulfotomaculales bacterium]
MQFLVALAGVVLFVWVLGPARYRVDGFEVRGALRPAVAGRTVIELPPAGTLTARTHAAPVELRVTLLGVEEQTLTRTLANPDLARLRDRVWQDGARALKLFALRQVALGLLGAVLLTWLLLRPPLRRLWQPALAGLLAMLAWLAPAAASYDTTAFEHPAYSGVIAAAPRVLQFSTDLVAGLQEFKEATPVVVANLRALADQVQGLDGFATDASGTRLLLIADLHNNPVGLALARNLAASFAVDAVLDAGDLTDLGSPLEMSLLRDLEGFAVPYVFAPGNHDTPEVMDRLASMPGVQVLRGKVVETAGLRIIGSPDPSAYRFEPRAPDAAREGVELRAQADALAEALARTGKEADVLLVHDPRVARRLAGRVPLVVYGHTHRIDIATEGASVLLNPGTTGAAGIRGLQATEEIPYSAMVVHMDAEKRLTAVDIITYRPREGSFRVERRVMAADQSRGGR